MVRIASGVFILLLTVPASLAQDAPQDKPPPTPAEQFKALVNESKKAEQAFWKAYQEAKTPEDKHKVDKQYPQPEQFAGRFLELAEQHSRDPAALDALVWVIIRTRHFGSSASNSAWSRALGILERDHLTSDQLAVALEWLSEADHQASETFLRQVLDQNPSHEVQGKACLALAQFLQRQARLFERMKSLPLLDLSDIGVVLREALLRQAAARRLQESEELFERVVEKYAEVKDGRATLSARAKAELYQRRGTLALGKPAPEIEGEDIDGQQFKLSDYRGKVVLLAFWGHW
jgi:tetratricopeptide (TPR) repeat protein